MAASGPEPLLEVVLADSDIEPTLTGFCAGFEAGRWRATELARHLFEWLPDFALTSQERDAIGWHNAAEALARAARNVYVTDDHERRGEFGELLLHAVIQQHFKTVPAISKVFFKDGPNETVKGFDAVHVVVADDGGLELWLGEAKFYGDLGDAIRRIADDLVNHTEPAWLRGEFVAIGNKIEPAWPQADDLRDLIHRNRSLDQIFTSVRIPALVSYDSAAAAAAAGSDGSYREAVEIELRDAHRRLLERQLPPVSIHLLLVPLANKAALVEALDRRLRIHLEL